MENWKWEQRGIWKWKQGENDTEKKGSGKERHVGRSEARRL